MRNIKFIWHLLFLGFLFSLEAKLALAEIMSEQAGERFSSGLDFLWVQQADRDREERTAVHLSYESDQYQYLSLGGSLYVAPDFDKKSARVNITKDFYEFVAEAVASYTYLFRYHASFGFGALYQRVHSVVLEEHALYTEWKPLATFGVGLTYAFNRHWELSFSFTSYQRLASRFSDWSYGPRLSYVLR